MDVNDRAQSGKIIRLIPETGLGYIRVIGGDTDGWEYPFRWDAVRNQLPLKLRQEVDFRVNDSEMLDWISVGTRSLSLDAPDLYPFGKGGRIDTGSTTPQCVLDPKDRAKANDIGTPAVPAELREQAATYTHLPNVDDWLPGDLLLFADAVETQKNLWKRIWTYTKIDLQLGSVPDFADARWTHAAMYVGHYHLCEALPGKGIIYRSILSYFKDADFRLRVRRMPGMTIEQRHSVTVKAMSGVRRNYGYRSVIRALRKAPRPLTDVSPVVTHSRSVHAAHCAELYCSAYDAVGIPLHKTSAGNMTPAELSGHSDLQDIALHWVRLK